MVIRHHCYSRICDGLCTMTSASYTRGLGVLCVVVTIVAAGEKLQFVLRIFLFYNKVKSTVKCNHPAAGRFSVQL